MLPIEPLSVADYISIEDFSDWSRERDRNDQEKRRKLFGKVIYSEAKKFQSGRELRFWSCFVPNRATWSQLSKNAGIQATGDDESSNGSTPDYLNGFLSGLFTSTKGMPTGISLELRPRGSAGYVPNFFIIVDDPSLSFDIGRKSIQSRQQGMLRDIAFESFRTYINSVRKYMGGLLENDPVLWERDEIFSAINQMADLSSSRSKFLKRPNGQEATVAAIFFELIGSGIIKDIQPLTSGYKGRYDLYAKWENRNIVIEFKFELNGLFKDFTDEKKMFDEIDVVTSPEPSGRLTRWWLRLRRNVSRT